MKYNTISYNIIHIIVIVSSKMFLNLDSAFPGLSLKDSGGVRTDNPYKSYLGRSQSQHSSCFEEISYQEVREEIIERKQPGRKLDIPIRIRDTAGGGGNKTNSESLHLNKHSPSPVKTAKVGGENEISKPFTRKLTYTVPIEGAQAQSPQKVFPPKSTKKIQFGEDEKRSKYKFSSHQIIKDQSKPTPPDVDDDDDDEQSRQRGKKSYQEPRWKYSTGLRLPLNVAEETDRSIKISSELTKVGDNQSGGVSKLFPSFS